MINRQSKTKRLREEIEILQSLGYPKKEICTKISLEKGLHFRHIGRVIREMVNEPTILKKRTIKNQKVYKINSKQCYFCGNKKDNIFHHVSYNPEVVVRLCRSCHGKIHFLQKKDHEANIKKDSYIKKVHDSLEDLNKILFPKKSSSNNVRKL